MLSVTHLYVTRLPYMLLCFAEQQAGPYIGLVILALLAGMGMMFAAMLVYFRAAVGVGLRDRVGHARFQG